MKRIREINKEIANSKHNIHGLQIKAQIKVVNNKVTDTGKRKSWMLIKDGEDKEDSITCELWNLKEEPEVNQWIIGENFKTNKPDEYHKEYYLSAPFHKDEKFKSFWVKFLNKDEIDKFEFNNQINYKTIEKKQNNENLNVDKSKVYPTNAGKCDKCGFFKTWDKRIPNPKSGKLMPSHVTESGYLVNGGECPYWSSLKGNKKIIHEKKEERNSSEDFSSYELPSDDTGNIDKKNSSIKVNSNSEINFLKNEIKALKNEIKIMSTQLTQLANDQLKAIKEIKALLTHLQG